MVTQGHELVSYPIRHSLLHQLLIRGIRNKGTIQLVESKTGDIIKEALRYWRSKRVAISRE